jgi:carbon monoxide dehydrogenase subunit G
VSRSAGSVRATAKAPYEIVEHEPGRRFRYQVTAGPVRPAGTVRIEPAGTGTRVTVESDFTGRGIGKLFAAMARRQAAKEIPADLRTLKGLLEKT